MGKKQKNKVNQHYKNPENHQNGCEVLHSFQKTNHNRFSNVNSILEQIVNCYDQMIINYILKYYKGVFTIKCENFEMKKLLNWIMGNYFARGIYGLLKIEDGSNDNYVGVNVTITQRKNNNLAKTATVNFLNENGINDSFIVSDDNRVFDQYKIMNPSSIRDINNLIILENDDGISIIDYIRPWLTVSKAMFSTIIKKATFSNTSKIFELSPEAYAQLKKDINEMIFNDSGTVAYMRRGSDNEPWKMHDLGKDDINFLETAISNNVRILNLIKQFLGMRYNENFKAERNITHEFEQTNIVFSIFERDIKDVIEDWLERIRDKWNIKAYLEINTNFYNISEKNQENGE